MGNLTAELLNVTVYSTKPDVNLATLLAHARKNKILLHLLRALDIRVMLREQQELDLSDRGSSHILKSVNGLLSMRSSS
jgi:hypothetical protein